MFDIGEEVIFRDGHVCLPAIIYQIDGSLALVELYHEDLCWVNVDDLEKKAPVVKNEAA